MNNSQTEETVAKVAFYSYISQSNILINGRYGFNKTKSGIFLLLSKCLILVNF